MKELDKEKRAQRRKSPKKGHLNMELKEFAKHMKPFEWHGVQRDLSPELKRIVKNLAC